MNTFTENEKASSKAATLLFLSIIFLFVGSSLPFINPVTPRLNSDLMAFFGLGLFGMVTCFYLPREATRFSLTSLGMLCGGWLMLACVQYIAGINTTYFSYFLVTTSYLLAVVLLSAWVRMWIQAGQGRLLAETVMTGVLIAGLLQAASIWLQMLQLEQWLSPWLNRSASFPRQGGFLSQPNLCASLMVSAMVCLVFLKPEEGEQSARPTPWRLIAMGFMMLAVYATSSRTGYLEVFLVSAMLALVRQRLKISWVWVALVVWQLLAIGLGEVLASLGLMSGQLLEDSRKAVEASSNHRLRILNDVWLVIQQHPWMGVGWRQLQVTQVLTPGISEPVDHAHNIVAQIQVELGVLGTLSLLGFAGFWLLKKKPWLEANGAELAMVCVVMVLGLHSLLEYPLWHAMFLFLFGFAFSLLPEETYPVRLPLWLVKGLGLVLLFCAAWFYIDHHKSVSAYERFSQNQSKEELVANNKTVWWNRLLFESIFMINAPVNDNTRPVLRNIAKENANVYSQTIFINLPLLKIKIQDGETEVANQLGKRMCLNLSDEKWKEVQIHLRSLQDPRFNTWLEQLPPDTLKCRT
jgi:O-antigen ligase